MIKSMELSNSFALHQGSNLMDSDQEDGDIDGNKVIVSPLLNQIPRSPSKRKEFFEWVQSSVSLDELYKIK